MTNIKKIKLDELGRPDLETFKTLPKIPVSVLLNDIRSMLNVGSIFRTCDAFLVDTVYLCGITAQPPHREIQKTALGATESVHWEYHTDALKLVTDLREQGLLIIGIEQTSASLPMSGFMPGQDQKYLLVFGNEVEGIQDELLPLLDHCIEIPQAGTKHSLNVSVAAGIVLYYFYDALK